MQKLFAEDGYFDENTNLWYKDGSVCPVLEKLLSNGKISFPEMSCRKDPINPDKYLTVKVNFPINVSQKLRIINFRTFVVAISLEARIKLKNQMEYATWKAVAKSSKNDYATRPCSLESE